MTWIHGILIKPSICVTLCLLAKIFNSSPWFPSFNAMPISSSVNSSSADELYFKNVPLGCMGALSGQASFRLLLLSVKPATTLGRIDCLYQKHNTRTYTAIHY